MVVWNVTPCSSYWSFRGNYCFCLQVEVGSHLSDSSVWTQQTIVETQSSSTIPTSAGIADVETSDWYCLLDVSLVTWRTRIVKWRRSELYVYCSGCFKYVCHFESSFKINCEPVCSNMPTWKCVFLLSRVPLLTPLLLSRGTEVSCAFFYSWG
jgi:hypothetical protein